MQIVNMTPHPVHIVDEEGNITKTYDMTTKTIRLAAQTVKHSVIDGIQITSTVYGEAEGLPEYDEGTYLIVSQLVKTALPERKDLLVPAEVVRDSAGNIIGCRSLGI